MSVVPREYQLSQEHVSCPQSISAIRGSYQLFKMITRADHLFQEHIRRSYQPSRDHINCPKSISAIPRASISHPMYTPQSKSCSNTSIDTPGIHLGYTWAQLDTATPRIHLGYTCVQLDTPGIHLGYTRAQLDTPVIHSRTFPIPDKSACTTLYRHDSNGPTTPPQSFVT